MRSLAQITIASSTTISAAADVGPENQFYGIEMSAAWTAGNITFQVSNDGTNFQALIDDAGVAVTVTAPGAGQTVLFRSTIIEGLAMFRHVKVVSQNAQAADRAIFLLSRVSSA